MNPVLSAGLVPNMYYATIRITSPDVMNSPMDFGLILNVTPPTVPEKPQMSTAGLVFVTTAAGSSPAPQNVQVYASSNSGVPYQASAAAGAKAAWLSVSPSIGSSSSAGAGLSGVSVAAAGLAPGVYTGGVSYAFSSAAVRTVNVTLVVEPAPLSTQSVCVPVQAVPTQIGLVDNFELLTGLPTAVAVSVLNDCGAPVTNAQVEASFSNGDPPLMLAAVSNSSGVFSGTWTPRSVSPQTAVMVNVKSPQLLDGISKITGQVATGAAPLLAPDGGTVHVFNPEVGGALAPGTIVEIFGSNLSAGVAQASGEPLTTSLGGTSVLIGGIAAPLFYVSPGQIDAQLPFSLAPGMLAQVQVNNSGALSTPDVIHLTSDSPGIAVLPSGQVIAQRYPDNSLVTDATPARPGDYLTIYLVGLGATDQPVAAGSSSPSGVLVRPLIAPVLYLSGNPVPVAFGGLTPGSVGLYQINFQVPAGTPDGDLTLLVSQGGVNSNVTTLPVKH
jgi:adhesin/invasin